ncbi:DUF2339 domain-containing protein [Terrimonas sp. NA20]|uniref:DUF2339 domain-containing protein n=1 Tax=Terrimonas ginsenosidimutans TaxID=2908004 RepID=A0ABS9KXQ7_9BACT|nr:DUF2339 domain-containing protein [Terrimonas ginsenosidimutans]MCG2617119.1 DUF2339 domain-containing protein [Terrimonas ginsenosidimutans]
MNAEERIHDLERQLHQLSSDLQHSQQQLRDLQQQLRLLKEQHGVPVLIQAEEAAPHAEQRKPQGIEHFIGLKLIHLVGIIVLVIGLSIGVKYAIDGQLISEMMRIVLAYSAGIVLFLLSVRLRKAYTFFSAILFSGSMASIYFTTYACFTYYHFISGGLAFAIMALLTVYTILTAIKYDRKEIAVIGMVGAYGIPFLISSNSDRFEQLFSYMLLINIGVVYLSFRRSWKLVGQLAMIITWTLVIGWAFMRSDQSQDQWIGLLFVIVFYLLFCINAMSFLIIRKQPLSFMESQQLLVNHVALFLASLCLFDVVWASGMVTVWTAGSALIVTALLPKEKFLQRGLVIVGLMILLLWISLRWDGLFVTLLWVLVSVLLFAWGIAGRQSWVRLTAVTLIGLTLLKLLVIDSGRFTPLQKIICYIAIGVLLLLFSFYYQRLGLAVGREKEKQS